MSGITLFHCEARSERDDTEQILSTLLKEGSVPFDWSVVRGTFNYPESNRPVVNLLANAGFNVRAEQVCMQRGKPHVFIPEL